MKIAVTTSRENQEVIKKAEEIARQLNLVYLPRKKRCIDSMRSEYGLSYLLVVEKERVILQGDTRVFWHPNMAVPRLKCLRQGKSDNMIEAMQLKPKDRLLDCTLGLAADALVAAYVVGIEGLVTGLEASKYLSFLTKWGMENYRGQNTHVRRLLKRITVLNVSYEEYLNTLPEGFYDVIYFDPMFNRGLKNSSGINAIRPLACYKPLSREIIDKALKATRRRVVVKSTPTSDDLHLLKANFIVGGKHSSVLYGVWEKEG